MAFITDRTGIISFAEYSDVKARDLKVFKENKGLIEDDVEDQLIRSTERMMTMLKDSSWWTSNGPEGEDPDINLIIGRENDFNEACVDYCLYHYVYPQIADFGQEDNAEVQKIDYFENEFNRLITEIVNAGDFYDFSDTGTITDDDTAPGAVSERLTR